MDQGRSDLGYRDEDCLPEEAESEPADAVTDTPVRVFERALTLFLD